MLSTSTVRETLRLIAATALCALLGACVERNHDAAAARRADVEAIEALNQRLLGALNSGDWQGLNAMTPTDFVAIVGGNAIEGKQQIDSTNQRFLESWTDAEQWTPAETVVDGDLAFQRGSFTMRLTPRTGGGDARNLKGSYIRIYQRGTDGAWALTRTMAASAR
jgi:ketosteroid isomerase-like protein